jgi:hypothetical protein
MTEQYTGPTAKILASGKGSLQACIEANDAAREKIKAQAPELAERRAAKLAIVAERRRAREAAGA